jgi:hypothetical protein
LGKGKSGENNLNKQTSLITKLEKMKTNRTEVTEEKFNILPFAYQIEFIKSIKEVLLAHANNFFAKTSEFHFSKDLVKTV